MSNKKRIGLFCALIGMGAALAACRADSSRESGYRPGGKNVESFRYGHSDGYPPFPEKADFIGVLKGDWREMGRQFGAKSGEKIRYVSDIWWNDICEFWGINETRKAFGLYEAQIKLFEPGLVEYMKGVAEGASAWLGQSPFADSAEKHHSTNYERVLAVNLWDAWTMMHPKAFPDGSSTYGGVRTPPPPELRLVAGCSAFAARGKATVDGAAFSAHNRHSAYNPRCYQQALLLKPSDGLACWVLTNSPQLTGNQIVNEKGVSISLLAGGATNPRSIDVEGRSYVAEAFGVPWFHLFLYVGTHAGSAREAIEMLTKGTADYRGRSGRETLLQCGGWNFLVADGETLAVVEATANRYAVRYAGEAISFSGAAGNDPDYIVATNHFVCEYSFDEKNNRTNIPMTIFQDGYRRDPETGEIAGLNPSGERFWTLLWDIKHHLGRIDRYRIQQIMSGTYAYDKDTGEKIDVAQDREGKWRVYGNARPCTEGYLSEWDGTCDSKIAVLTGDQRAVYWTLGNPSDWQGAWDAYLFNRKKP